MTKIEKIKYNLNNRIYTDEITSEDKKINLIDEENVLYEKAIERHQDIIYSYLEASNELKRLMMYVADKYLPAPKNPEIDAFIIQPIKSMQNALHWGFIYGLRGNMHASKQQLRFAIEALCGLVYFMNEDNRNDYRQELLKIAQQQNTDAKTEMKMVNDLNKKIYKYSEKVDFGVAYNLRDYKDVINIAFAHSSTQNPMNLQNILTEKGNIASMNYFDSPELREQFLPENIISYTFIGCQMYHLLFAMLKKEFPTDSSIKEYDEIGQNLKASADEAHKQIKQLGQKK